MNRTYLPRALSREDATLMVGDMVPDRHATLTDLGTVIHDADTGQPVLGYMKLPDAADLRRAVLSIDISPGGVRRHMEYQSRSRTFGYAPRRPIMGRDACNIASLMTDNPTAGHALETYADKLAGMLGDIEPELVKRGETKLADVLPEWRLGETKLWTSGVVNDTAQLPYHRDNFNFPVWSAMPVLRRGTRGGYLHVPEYSLVIECRDASVVLFEGSKYLHGVTPITHTKPGDGYRISVVYYALQGTKNCRTAAEEAAYGRRKRTESELQRARRMAAGDRPRRKGGSLVWDD